MKVIALCVVPVLICSCHPSTNSARSDGVVGTLARMDELNALFKEYQKRGNPYYVDRDFLFRGPLTIDQVQTELMAINRRTIEALRRMAPMAETSPDSGIPAYRSRIVSRYKPGDKLYFFASDPKRPEGNCELMEGYLLLRGNAVAEAFVWLMN